MDEVTPRQDRSKILKKLAALNPKARPDDLSIYVDAFLDYREAADNISRNGNIVSHPRTGTPIENPYIKVRASATFIIRKIKIKTGDLWGS